jgi:hypothetical protein
VRQVDGLRRSIDGQPKARSRAEAVAAPTTHRSIEGVAGIEAIVLGGSYASGTHHETSDLDVGLYYFEAKPFSIAAIWQIADNISVRGPATVTDFYEWGAWVNGGAWIHTQQGKVDFLYRNLDQVQQTIAEAQQGISRHDYNQQLWVINLPEL